MEEERKKFLPRRVNLNTMVPNSNTPFENLIPQMKPIENLACFCCSSCLFLMIVVVCHPKRIRILQETLERKLISQFCQI